jgi:adenylate kinase family enzyme
MRSLGLSSDIILIGPVRTGKSTVGKLLADELGLPQVSLDNLRWKYYAEIGYDPKLAEDYRRHGGFLALVLYRNLFTAYAVERLLMEYHNCVFDFGADIYDSLESFARVRQALAACRNVILLLPSRDIEESLQILTARDAHPPTDLNFDFNRHFVSHHTYYDLAKLTVYTKGKAPEETCQEILKMVAPDFE